MKKIAIIGATGYIGKSLARELAGSGEFETALFSRSKEKLETFLKSLPSTHGQTANSLSDFGLDSYDVIINCAGIGNPALLKKAPADIFKVTEDTDALIIQYLEKRPDTIYINLSSGAAYGPLQGPATSDTKATIDINTISPGDFYAIAKIHSEAKHRAMQHLNIVDLRVFAFFSRYIDLDSNFFMADVAKCIKAKTVLETRPDDMERDYVTASDLLSLIKAVVTKGKLNDVFDVYSLAPVSKFELLERLGQTFGLKYKMAETGGNQSPTGEKRAYYSKNHKAESLGYTPKYGSIEGIEEELREM